MPELDLDHVSSFAKVSRDLDEASPYFLDSIKPHAAAVALLRAHAGVKLEPLQHYGAGLDLRFNPQIALACESEIIELCAILKQDLCPVADVNSGNGVLLLGENGKCFTISTEAPHVFYLGDIHQAIATILTGKDMRPVLPIRDYPQRLSSAGFDVYPPDSIEVFWVNADHWICETREDEDEE